MPKATEHHTTSRRALLGAAIAFPAAALPVAALAGGTPDAGLIRLANEILALEAETNRLARIEDEFEDWTARHRFNAEHIRPLSARHHVLMEQFVQLRATTMDGFRAKARVLQAFNNCSAGYAEPDDPDALGWSLANDLLGEPSVWTNEDDADVLAVGRA